MINHKRKTKILFTVGAILILLVLLSLLALSIYIYQSNFNLRFETAPESMQTPDAFSGLLRERNSFASNKGQTLIGYTYFKNDAPAAKAVIIMAHGFGGGGHTTYMDTADYFATNGYVVFAYDATGNDESEGDGVGGMPQGLIDLDYAVRFVKQNPEFAGLPIMLFGHSWGAYSAGSVLSLHPDIKAVVMGAGFNQSIDMIEEEGRRLAGSGIDLILPWISLIEHVKFGKYASYSCLDGFASSNAGVMIVHSVDDEVVSFAKQFEQFYHAYQNDPRFVFVRYEDRGHNGLFMDSGSLDTALMDRIISFYDGYAR